MQNPSALTAAELKRRLDAGQATTLVDVREPDEHAAWRIPGSRNVPLDEVLAGAALPAGPLVLYCASGARSALAQQALAARGVRAEHLDGGMVAWNSVYDAALVHRAEAEVLQVRRVGKGCLSYMVLSGGEALVIDPTADVEEYLALAAERGARIVAVADTHAHADHVSGSRALVAATGARYHAPDEVGPSVPHERVTEGTALRVGDATLVALETPGHTPQSVTYRLGELLFTGDTLFVESVGRPDLGQDARPNADVLWRSIHEKLLPLGRDARVLPGHFGDGVEPARGAAVEATIGGLVERVKALSMPRDAFVEWVVRNALPKPANFETIKRVNQGLVSLPPRAVRALEAGPNRCAVSG